MFDKKLAIEQLKKAKILHNHVVSLGDIYVEEMNKFLSIKKLKKDDRIRVSISSLAMVLAWLIAHDKEENVGKALDQFVRAVHSYVRIGGLLGNVGDLTGEKK